MAYLARAWTSRINCSTLRSIPSGFTIASAENDVGIGLNLVYGLFDLFQEFIALHVESPTPYQFVYIRDVLCQEYSSLQPIAMSLVELTEMLSLQRQVSIASSR